MSCAGAKSKVTRIYEAASYKIETIPNRLAAMSIETDEDTSKFKKAARRESNVQGAGKLIEGFTDKKTVVRSHHICPSVCGIQLFTVLRIWRLCVDVCPYSS